MKNKYNKQYTQPGLQSLTKQSERISLAGHNLQSETTRAIHKNPTKTTCTCYVNTKEHQRGPKSLWRKGNEAIIKEFRQLHDKKALMSIKKEEVSYNECDNALRYLMFLKEKRDGSIKARGYAGGHNENI